MTNHCGKLGFKERHLAKEVVSQKPFKFKYCKDMHSFRPGACEEGERIGCEILLINSNIIKSFEACRSNLAER